VVSEEFALLIRLAPDFPNSKIAKHDDGELVVHLQPDGPAALASAEAHIANRLQ
jgi:hypothetical protein